MKSVTTHEAKTHLSRLLGEVEAGEEIIIRRGDRAIARLVAMQAPERRRPRVGEVTSGPIEIREGALEPLSDPDLEPWGL